MPHNDKHNYKSIQEELDRRIHSGEWEAGFKIPSEPDLAKEFQVSRETVRSAIKQLENEGKLRVRSGIGRFVLRPLAPIPSSIDRFTPTEEMLRNAGLEEGQLEQFVRREICRKEWAEYLQISPGDPVIINERTRTANGEPVSYNINIMPEALVGDAFERTPLTGSLARFLEKECGRRLVFANTEIIVPLPDDPVCLKLTSRDPGTTTVLLLKQNHYDQNNVPTLFSYDYFRNDIFRFWVRRTR